MILRTGIRIDAPEGDGNCIPFLVLSGFLARIRIDAPEGDGNACKCILHIIYSE